MDNETLATLIRAYREGIHQMRGTLASLIKDCPHDIKPSDSGDYAIAKCHICNNRHLGWYCPDSPTNLCEYPDPGDQQVCVHCNEPSDRK